MKWKFLKGRILENQLLAEDVWHMIIDCPEIASACWPGSFIMLRTGESETYLPRPMAVFTHDTATLEVCYRVKGAGTKIMADMPPGKEIIVTGPLGAKINHDFQNKAIAVVGRGVGITPLYSVAQAAKQQGAIVTSFLSARTKELLIGKTEFGSLGQVYVQTDDDTTLITDELAALLRSGQRLDYLYVSGSKRLLQHCKALGKEYGLKVFVFLESNMACGVGYCKGCAVEVKNSEKKYALCCKDGPLFSAEDVVL